MRSAVLFIIFNRPETTKQVFKSIREAKPPRLYVAADGPRENILADTLICQQTREIVQNVDWPCELKLLFREKNLGCKYGVSSAISWFFNEEEEGIIIEDDVVPSKSFYGFCDVMLEKYRNNHDVMMISGFNPFGANEKNNSYFFSKMPGVWGWASWRRFWKFYSVDLPNWPDKALILDLAQKLPKYVINHHSYTFDLIKKENLDTWDYQLTYTILKNNGLIIRPFSNLVTNIGVVGTHAQKKDQNHYVEYGIIELDNLLFPEKIIFDEKQDLKFYKSRIKPLKFRKLIRSFLYYLGILKLIKRIQISI
jgi:hypothetical protein